MRRDRITAYRVGLGGMLALAGCVLQTGGQGGGGGNVAEDGTTTTNVFETSTSTSATATAAADDPQLETGLETTEGLDPSTSMGPDSSGEDPSTGTSTGDGTTGEPVGCNGDGDCPANWQCVAPDCVNPDEGDPCAMGCGPAAPLCGADQLCHDGTEGDSCDSEDDCLDPLACSPTTVCQDGSEGDPCAGPEDCGASAPHCPYDGNCHNGNFGDPCDNSGQCNIVCIAFFCV